MLRKSLAAGLTLALPLAITVGVLAGVWNLGGRFTAQVGGSTGSCRGVSEYALPPVTGMAKRIAPGPGGLWFIATNAIGRITTTATVTMFPLSTQSGTRSLGGITAGPDGNVWFTSGNGPSVRDTIGKIAADGTVTEYPVPNKGFSSGMGDSIVAGPDGNLWYTMRNRARIGKVTPQGSVTEYPLPLSWTTPEAIAAGPDGNLWFVLSNGNKIDRITPGGTITEFPLPTGVSTPRGITAGPDGNLWFSTGDYAGKIGKMTTSGVITMYDVPAGGELGNMPRYIVRGPGGDTNLWFASNRLGRATPSGTITLFPLSNLTSGGAAADIAVGPDGNLWLAMTGANSIVRVILNSCTPPQSPASSSSSANLPGALALSVNVASGGSRTGNTETLQRNVVYSISNRNAGTVTANAVKFRIPLPSGAVVTDTSGLSCPVQNNILECTLGNVPPSSQYDLTVSITMPCGTSMRPFESLTATNAPTATAGNGNLTTTVSGTGCASSSSSSTTGGCTDTDGSDPSRIGTVTTANGKRYTDFFCPGQRGVAEFICTTDGGVTIADLYCPPSTHCEGGVCVPGAPRSDAYCTDSDGGHNNSVAGFVDWYVPRQIGPNGQNLGGDVGSIDGDQCRDRINGTEKLCSNGTPADSGLNCPVAHVCVNGRCVQTSAIASAEATCRDSDEGMNAGTAGNVTVTINGQQRTYEDFCGGAGYYEFGCSGDVPILATGNCAFGGCSNGACQGFTTSQASSVSSLSSVQASSIGPSSASTASFPAAPAPDICSPVCGDALKVGPEECDDGNKNSGDGCSAACKKEASSSSSATSFSRSSSSSSFSSFSSSSSVSSISSSSSSIRCPTDPCGAGGSDFCGDQGRTCVKDLSSPTCIRCDGAYQCKGDECGQGGSQYCASLGGLSCEATPGGICIECRSRSSSSAGILCPPDACGLGGNKYCAAFGKSCRSTSDGVCIECFPEPSIACSGTGVECKQGGDDYCAALGATCKPQNSGICINCVKPGLPGQCTGSNYECTQGGSQYCALFGKTCRGTDDGICIACGGPGEGPEPLAYQCQGDECTKRGAAYCATQGLNCRNIPDGVCISCTTEGCRSALDCAAGSQCVSGKCVQLCGNGRLDPGEACDPSSPLGAGGGGGCTSECLLDEQQQCTYDTECGTGLCIRNLCVPCTRSTQCQSNDCRQGTCRPLCGNGVLDPGEMCDPVLEALCTRNCLRPAGNACRVNQECQTGLCQGGACVTCVRSNQCGSGLCVSGACVDVCGNGTINPGEECDDGNRVTGDGCSRFCRREATVAGEILPISLLGEVTRGGTIEGADVLGDTTLGESRARSLVTAHAAAGETGPAALAVIAGGAAAGWAWMRRRRKS